jgi:dolichol-phosphate mannosyltransferase
MVKRVGVSVVIPVYNEEEVISITLGALEDVAQELHSVVEVIVVNDGSNDSTLARISEYSTKKYHLRIIEMKGNQGHMAALTAGMLSARGKYVVTMDADMQDPPEIILDLYESIRNRNVDIVQAVRRERSTDTHFKAFSATMYYRLMNYLIPNRGNENSADFRIMTAEVSKTLANLPEKDKIYRNLIPILGYSTLNVYFDRSKRAAGETKYPLKKMLLLGINSVFSATSKPLHAISIVGVTTTSLLFIGMVITLVEYATARTVSGWASILMVILFTQSVILVSIGVLGEYVARIYDISLNRPAPRYVELPQESFRPKKRV